MDNLNHSRPVLTYPIASGEMYYEVVNQRTVYLQGDPEAGFSLVGEIPDWGEGSSVNLAKMLLEYAMTWNATGDVVEARRQMRYFGRRLGEALVTERVLGKPVYSVMEGAADALEDVFRSLDASFARHRSNGVVRYQLGRPSCLQMAAEVTTSTHELELAHHALQALCERVVGAYDSHLRLRLPNGPNEEQTVIVAAPTDNGWRSEEYSAWANQNTGQWLIV